MSSVCCWYLIKPHEQNDEENPGPDMNVNDPYRGARLWWPCSIRKLWEPDEISKNPNLSPRLERAASWGGGWVERAPKNKKEKEKKQAGTSRDNIICLLFFQRLFLCQRAFLKFKMIPITGNLWLHCWQLIWKMTASFPQSWTLTAKLLRAKVGCEIWTPASHQGINTIATLNKRETLEFSAAFYTNSSLLLQMGKKDKLQIKGVFPSIYRTSIFPLCTLPSS